MTKKVKVVFTKENVNNSLLQWLSFFKAMDYQASKKVAEKMIRICKEVITNSFLKHNNNSKDHALAYGIFFHSLINLTELIELTNSGEWINDAKDIDIVWVKFCDFKERYDYSTCYIELSDDIKNFITTIRERIEQYFLDNFGPGMYMSPVIVMKKAICNICGNDYRTCNHLRGAIYKGKRCFYIPESIRLTNVSLVDTPEDPRCRIWAWNTKNDKENWIRILSLFKLEAFLDE